jgi:S-adenosylmethionine synthetase
VIGGPQGDSGLTGRKIIVDTYGGYGHPAAVVLRKDPTRWTAPPPTRSHVAKNIVAAGLAKKCEVGVAYAIGVARLCRCSSGYRGHRRDTGRSTCALVLDTFDLGPAIIEALDLRKPVYRQVAPTATSAGTT